MNRTVISLILLASVATTGYAFAQDTKIGDAAPAVSKMQKDGHAKRGPIDLQKFSQTDDLKAADTNNDGNLSRDEIEAHVLKQLVQRRADRMERRLDVDGDGKVTLSEVENQKAKEFAALDRNNDGKLDRKELRAAHHGKHSDRGRMGHHGKHAGHHKKMHNQ